MGDMRWITDLYMSVYNWMCKADDLKKALVCCLASAILAGILVVIALLWVSQAEAAAPAAHQVEEVNCPAGQLNIEQMAAYMQEYNLQPVSVFKSTEPDETWWVIVGKKIGYTAVFVTYANACSEFRVSGTGEVFTIRDPDPLA